MPFPVGLAWQRKQLWPKSALYWGRALADETNRAQKRSIIKVDLRMQVPFRAGDILKFFEFIAIYIT